MTNNSEVNKENLESEANRLCLEFANTAEWHASDQPTESLNNFVDLVAWAQRMGIYSEPEAQHQLQKAARHSHETTVIFEQAIVLREAIYRIFSATAAGQVPNAADMATLNLNLTRALGHLQIGQIEAGFTWIWGDDVDTLDRMLWPIARSAAELLTSEEMDRVKECEDDRGCGYLFFDTSRNRSRRWCDMRGCGNRAKVRRHRKQKQSA